MLTKKLIEVALPLEKINEASAREKSIRHGHPSTLHLWWARRPLAAARAVIWSSLVDDPSSHPDQFPTEEDQNKERQRLFKILEDLVVWENSNNKDVLNKARAEIMKSTNNNPPALLDPFAGGGAIPLEAQRLGLEAHAHDLNPVAVMINKAMIEIPPRFANKPPVNPDSRNKKDADWTGAKGLAEDVRYYGEWMKQEAFKRIGHLYPKVKVPESQGGGEATVIAWIWARTVKCPNPACGCETPLVHSFILSKKRGQECYIEPVFSEGRFYYSIKRGKPKHDGTVGRTGARCLHCNSSVDFEYIRSEGKQRRIQSRLMATVADGKHGRVYVEPDDEQENAAKVDVPERVPETFLPEKALGFRVQGYGMDQHKKLFTNRQLTVLTTFSDLISEVQAKVKEDALVTGLYDDHLSLCNGGLGALGYGQAIGVYLSFTVDRLADRSSSFCGWDNGYVKIRNTFGRHALPMSWDYAEGNPFSNSTGCFESTIDWVVKCLCCLPASSNGLAQQRDAQSDCGMREVMVSTDPPYYDNIGYADLSDFFYIWLRRSLKETYPNIFRTMLVPKAEELIASPFRHNGNTSIAKEFFEKGMLIACSQLYQYSCDTVPVTIYYAYKQSDADDTSDGQASSGWETMLSAIIQAGFSITGTWPMRTEMANRQVATGTNALASSIVLVCRKRPHDAPVCTRRNFINELKYELRPALQKLQSSNIAPVDLAQSAIGPGMGIFSKYAQVLEANGNPMSVRSALKIINQELDLYFNEQDGELDSESRFCVDFYTQVAFDDMKFGDANTLATAKNTSVAVMASNGTLYAQKGVVHLIERSELSSNIHHNEDCVWKLCQQLTYCMEKEGVEGCAKVIYNMLGSNVERAKDLAYRLYTIADRNKWTQEAYAYNTLIVAWPEIQSRAAELKASQPKQRLLFDKHADERLSDV
ncbi:MAG: DUF1156 domain-containing protein [Thermoguttaceae bacterium]|nr:DUF1156 domain-containing protein [Thermoguttaceae bacterium]